MTAQSAIPLKWYVPFAQGDSSRVELPVTTTDATRASQTLGFPPLTMQPPESGGVPPQGEDFNGGMNQVARICWWILNGGGWPYDSTFATNSNINGYPNGAKLQSADLLGDWISTADNNQNNPDTGTGVTWVPGFQYGVTALTGLTGGTVTLTPAQAAKGSITLAGTLTSALTLVIPTWLKNWTITNNTTGAFVAIVKTAAGSGVTIPQTSQPTRVSGDGTNIVQAAENVAAATQPTNPMQLGQATGRLLNVRHFLASTTYTPTPGTTAIRVIVVGGGAAGGSTNATGAGQVGVGGGGGAGGYAESYLTTGFSGATITIGAGGTFSSPAGGTTSFGASLSASGGLQGGTGATAVNAPPFTSVGGNGGIGSGGNVINGQGGQGSPGVAAGATSFVSGGGGQSALGAGGNSLPTSTNTGSASPSAGGGGGGALAGGSTGAQNGGAGSSGAVIVYEYS